MLAAIGAVVFPSGYVSLEVVLTVVMTGLYGLGALLVSAIPARKTRTRAACLITAGLSFAGYLGLIWLSGSMSWTVSDWVHRISGSALIVSLALAQRLILIPLPIRSTVGRVARRAGLIAGASGAAFACVEIILMPDGVIPDQLVAQLLMVAVIVAVGGSIGAGVVWFGDRKPEHADPGLLGAGVAVKLDCPRCGGPIEARSNREARCGGCRLKVRVEVDEPRCVCGYLLYELVGAVCPECGKDVPEADRWAAPA